MNIQHFFQWLSTLNPWLEIVVIVGLFVGVVGLILFFVEIAPRKGTLYTVIRLVACVVGPALVLIFLGSWYEAAAVAAVLGLLFFFLDKRAKDGAGSMFQLVGFLTPALGLLAVGLVVPTIQTTVQAFMNSRGTEFVGLDNFAWIFTQPQNVRVIVNTILWVLIAPVFSTIAGLAYAYFIDKIRGEKYYKIFVFMPMAISFVGASIIWRFMYTQRPSGQEQIGFLNQIVVWFGGQPYNFLADDPWNTFWLILVFIWIQTGFAMVILSAAIKGVPTEQLEAAELDGTNAWQKFRNVVVPGIRPALIVVLTTISIASLKVFDIVRTMTAGANNTSVLANEMYTQFRSFEAGRSAAFALILFVLVLPIVIYNAVQLKKQREIR
ncbi:carbohydrate ABC transporter permease [Microbacterium sp. TNHR37B]|uniref:carbohydrate ABC transporter permease n=1 Tax=Microbacterium sp. TNHR37B TaxID=1775956 RepID=UPI0007B2C287|nr:sugar ABC transporter permease [Microbacterium sp. TNHR37B]KZE91896.1 Lactose transport system permease protein LacF [Microbacterium sp. TNHR37B]